MMPVFYSLFFKLIPLYAVIGLGFISGRFLGAQKETVSRLLIYIIAPIVIFYGVLQTELRPALLALPLIFFFICSFLALIFMQIAKLLWPHGEPTRNLLAFTAGSGNTGYFGIPVGLMILDQDALGPIVLCTLGFIMYEYTVGFFITAHGTHTAHESLSKIFKLPVLYAFAAAAILNLADIQIAKFITSALENFKSAYTILGMMIIGMGLATVRLTSFDFKLLGISFFAKFLVWPVLMAGLIAADINFLHLYDTPVHKVLFLLSIVPLAANTVTLATELKVHPEKAALAVLISTLFALIYIPFMVTYFMP